MLQFLEISTKFILGCGLALGFLVPLGAAHAKDFSVLYTFKPPPDGDWPPGGVIADSAGNFYGTTWVGGDVSCPGFMGYGCGTVFKLAPDGTETVLYAFTGTSGDGAGPYAGLIADSSGNLYSTTTDGGASNLGTVFKIAPPAKGKTQWKETVLYYFQGGTDGGGPTANLIADATGYFYGTTTAGGVNNTGTIFKVTPKGIETVLYTFGSPGGTDGADPQAGLIRDKAGNLYGTTNGGGASNLGTVFKLAPDGTETVLYAFTGINGDGALPAYGSLIEDNAGNLYGTTGAGGSGKNSCGFFSQAGCGTVFKISPKGHETVLYAFPGDEGGGSPVAGLIADKKGDLYGTTVYGGASDLGTVFKLASNGTNKVLYSFTGGSDGGWPFGTLIARMGYLYGTSYGCSGNCSNGAVFKLKE